ncbi:unnamed protein product [Leuciscus chuanchicus]
MAEDKGQNVKINLPTKTDDPKLSVGLVMVGGSHGKFNLLSPTNSICASMWGQKRGAAPRDQASPQAPAAPLHMFLFPNLIIPTPTRARFSESPTKGRGVFALAPSEKDASPEDCLTPRPSTLKFSLTAQ